MPSSLCDSCTLLNVCRIAVPEREVGKPWSGYGSKAKKRVLSCKYHTANVEEKVLRGIIRVRVLKILREDYGYMKFDEDKFEKAVMK